MKRKITAVLIILFIFASASLWARGASETKTTETTVQAAVTEFKAEMTSGDASSFSASYDSDGNYEITYKGTEEAVFTVSGTLDGTLIVKSDNASYTLILNGADIKGNTLPGLQLKSSTVCTLYLEDGTENSISDSSSNTKKGAVTSSGDIVIEGSGSLVVNVYKKHGIKLDGGLTVNSGNVTIIGDEKAEGSMISADVFFVLNGGNLVIRADGSVYGEESKGIKVNGVEGEDRACGYVEINGGNLDIVSVGKAVTAGWKAEDDAETEDTSDDPYAVVTVNGGYINISTTGTPYEVSDDESLSPEGIEGKDAVIINGGVIRINSTDDSINAGKLIQFNGGYVFATASDNDTIDANGTIEINGGTVVVLNSSNREQGIDCDNDNNFSYTGGTYVAVGNGNNVPKAAGTTAYTLAFGGTDFTSGTEIAVLDSAGSAVIGFTVPEGYTFNTIVFGSEDIKGNTTYTLAAGTFKDAVTTDGLVTSASSFTASKTLYEYSTFSYTYSNTTIGMNIGTEGFPGAFGAFDGTVPPRARIRVLKMSESEKDLSFE